MSLATTLMAVGIPAETANRLGYADRVPLDGNGTTQLGATEILPDNTNIALGTSVGDTAFILPDEAEYFQPYFLLNTTAEPALIYPPVGDTIDDEGLNVAISIDVDLARVVWRVEEGRWVSLATGPGGGGGSVVSVQAGTGIAVDNTDPANPVVSNTGVLSVSPGNNVSITGTAQNPIINADDAPVDSVNGQTGAVVLDAANVGAVATIVAGANITVDATDPQNPIVNSTASGSGTVETVAVATTNGFAGASDGDPANPVLTLSTTVNSPVLAGDGTALAAAVPEDARDYLDTGPYVADRTALAALDTTKDTVAWLKEAGREGQFQWDGADLSALVTIDTQQGIYVAPASDTTGASGAWVRVYTGSASVEWFGATGDGTTDDATAIQKAIDLVRDIWFPQGTYAVGTALTIGNGNSSTISTRNGYNLRGSTAGTTSVETAPVILPTCIKWIGAASAAAMLTINGPMVGCNIEGVVFDCNSLAIRAIKSNHMMLSTWQDVVVRKNISGPGIELTSYPTFSGMAQGANKNTFTNVRVLDCAGGGSGIRVGNTAATTSDVLDVAQNVFINCDFGRDGTNAACFSIWLAFCDNITFIECQTHAAGGSLGIGVYIKPPTGTGMESFPGEVLFLNCPIIGGVVTDGAWVPDKGIFFDPYPTGDGEPIPTSEYIHGRTFEGKFYNGIKIFGGSVTLAPLVIDAGTLLTTAFPGAIEFDGNAWYATAVASARQVVAAKQIATVQGSAVALSNSSTSAQSIFASANDTLTVAAATTYRFRAVLKFNTGATSHTTSFGFGGTATFTSCNYSSRATSSAANTLATPQQRRVAAATAAALTAASTAVTTDIEIEGIIRINGAGTIIPQVTFSAGPTGTCQTAIDSFFELEPVGSNTVVAIGNWS